MPASRRPRRGPQGLVSLLLSVAFAAIPARLPAASAIATAHPLATRAGETVLAEGGNAFDAAIAISATLAVVEPASSGLGGGGFWLLHRARDDRQVMIDGRERAPLAAGRDMYLDDAGRPVPRASIDGPLAAGIPGEVAALVHLSQHYARLPLARDLAPAIEAAEDGFRPGPRLRRMMAFRRDALRRFGGARIFLEDGRLPSEDFVLRQPELARTLRRIARLGRRGFYEGPVAEAMVEAVRAAGGIWTRADLSRYRIVERAPIVGHYAGMRIVSASPPSSGGIGLVTMLNILSHYRLERLPAVGRAHLLIEAMRRAYRDRAAYLGDPDFVQMPVERLVHPYYAAGLAQSIRIDRATASDELAPAIVPDEAPNTSHFSVVDDEGNRVSATLSINYPFGSGFVAGDTGVLLNDEMDDFSIRPGTANVYGLVGSEANAIAPGKRPLSSMTPTFVEGPRGIVVLGTPGGSRIITMVLQAVLEFARGGTPETMVALPRLHHQYLPDRVEYEPDALDPETARGLEALGHRLHRISRRFGNMQIVMQRPDGRLLAASDPRGEGMALVVDSRTTEAAVH